MGRKTTSVRWRQGRNFCSPSIPLRCGRNPLLSASHVFRHYRWPDQTRKACAAASRKRERNGDFCDEIGVPGEHCLGQETAAITGERKEDKKRQRAPQPSDVRSTEGFIPVLPKLVFCLSAACLCAGMYGAEILTELQYK